MKVYLLFFTVSACLLLSGCMHCVQSNIGNKILEDNREFDMAPEYLATEFYFSSEEASKVSIPSKMQGVPVSRRCKYIRLIKESPAGTYNCKRLFSAKRCYCPLLRH